MAWSHDDNVYFPDNWEMEELSTSASQDIDTCCNCGCPTTPGVPFCTISCEAEFMGVPDPTDIESWGVPENFAYSTDDDDLPF